LPGSATLLAGSLGQMMNVNKGPNYGYGYYQRAYQQSFYSGRDSSDDNATPKDNKGMFGYLRWLELELNAMKIPDGSRSYPAKTCRDIRMCLPDVTSGYYWIDPNLGVGNDAFEVYCNFTSGETCIEPKTLMQQKKKWVNAEKDGFKWMIDDLIREKIEYITDETQMRHLRLNSLSVRQNVTYHCKNSHAFKTADGGSKSYLKLMSSDNVEMHKDSHIKNRPKVLQDGCHVKDGKWHKTVLEVTSDIMSRLPISDVAVFDVADPGEEFGVELGPVCFS